MKKAFQIACVLLCTVGSADAATVVIAHTGQQLPGGNGNYEIFSEPVLNTFGQLAFRSDLTGTSGGTDDNQGIFLVDAGVGTVMCRTDWPTPNGNGRFDKLWTPALNMIGQVVFRGDARDTIGGSGHDSTGIYRSTGPGAVLRIARANTPAPDGNGWFDSVSMTPLLDNHGTTSFMASFRDTSGGYDDANGVLMNFQGVTKILARTGQTAPGGDGQYDSFTRIAKNDIQAIVFGANLVNTSGGADNNNGIYRAEWGSTSHIELVRKGDIVPGLNGYFGYAGIGPIYNNYDGGRVSFASQLTGTSGGSNDNSGIYLTGIGVIAQIAREGQAPPDGNGLYQSFTPGTTQGDMRVSFIANMRDTAGGGADSAGIYWGNTLSTHKIARGGEAVPDGNGVFASFAFPVSNIYGHTVFEAQLTGTASGSADNKGLYIGDGGDLLKVARKGDALLGSFITNLSMARGDYSRNGVNWHAQVAYRAMLANGNEALVLYTPPLTWKNGSGNWYAQVNWTLSIIPQEMHDVTIAPFDGADIIGPRTNASVKNLTIGDVGNLSTLRLIGEGDISVVNTCTVNPAGAIEIGDGRTLTAASIVNHGRIIIPESAEAWIHGPLDNRGDLEVALDAVIHVGDLTGKGGSGAGTVWLGGEVRPASGVGLMNFDGHVTFDPRCTTYIQLDPNTTVPTFDQIVVEGDLVLDGALVLDSAFTPAWLIPGRRLEIINVMGRAAGRFLAFDEGDRVAIFDGVPLHITYAGGDGNDVELYAVPEPATLALLAMGALTVLKRRRR